MNNIEEWIPWELYLIWLGERSVDYSYTKEMLYENIDYFKQCWKNHLSTYKALEWLCFEISKDFCCGNWDEYGNCKCNKNG